MDRLWCADAGCRSLQARQRYLRHPPAMRCCRRSRRCWRSAFARKTCLRYGGEELWWYAWRAAAHHPRTGRTDRRTFQALRMALKPPELPRDLRRSTCVSQRFNRRAAIPAGWRCWEECWRTRTGVVPAKTAGRNQVVFYQRGEMDA